MGEMTFSPDSPLVDRVLPVPTSEWYSRKGLPILAPMVHMAEGGGTDTWLTRPDGNSSHYTVKYDGSLVQQVPESYGAGSVNPRDIRTTDDAPFLQVGDEVVYGATAMRRILGSIPLYYINRVVIAIEIEGFARVGPNAAQQATLVHLIEDIRRRRPTVRGNLAHRDAQDYKGCPGRFIPWFLLGGHGLYVVEDKDLNVTITEYARRKAALLPDGARSFAAVAPYDELTALPAGWKGEADAQVVIEQTGVPHGTFVRLITGPTGRRLVPATKVTLTDQPDPTAALSAEVAALQARIASAKAALG